MRNNGRHSTVDLVVLGFLIDRPQGAYEIQKMVEFRNLSSWVKISAPSVYKRVLALELEGFLSGEAVREGNMPEKTVYSITDAGRARFREIMEGIAAAPVPVIFDLNAVVGNLSRLPADEARELVATMRSSVERGRRFVADHVPLRKDIPIAGRAIMEQQLRVYDALIAWLDEYAVLLVP